MLKYNFENTEVIHLFIIGRTASSDRTDPVQHDIVTVNFKEIRRSTSRHQPKYMLLVAIVINNVNKARPYRQCKSNVSSLLQIK